MKRDTKSQAQRLGLKPKTLENWRSLRIGPPYYKLGNRVLYDDAESDAWLATCRRTGASESGQAEQ